MFTYIINAGPKTFTLPLINNNDCDMHIELYDTAEPTDYQATVPMTFVDCVTTVPDLSKPLKFDVTTAAYITMDLTDTLLDNTVVTLLGKAVSDDPLLEEPPQTFIFTIEIYDRPCVPNLQLNTPSSDVIFHLEQLPTIVEFNADTNGNCEYTLILADSGVDPPVPTTFAAVTLV